MAAPIKTHDDLVAFVSASSFHQCLHLPSDTQQRITYGTTRNFANTALPAVLYVGPMGISRLALYYVDHVAAQAGVRIVFIDRPGFGGSTPVPVARRIGVYLDAVPVVLQRLGIEHVALLCHSAGGVYLQNILSALPHLLHPQRPTAVAFAPWTHPRFSHSRLLGLAERLPGSWIANLDQVTNVLAAPLSFSGGVVEKVGNLFGAGSDMDEATAVAAYGVSAAMFKELVKMQMEFSRAEGSGMGEEATLCLKKQNLSWAACEDLPTFLTNLAASHSERAGSQSTTTTTAESSAAQDHRLVFRAVFAQSDMIIGKGGQAYYEKCWSHPSLTGGIVFSSVTVPGSNHDNVALPNHRQMQKELQFIKERTECS